MAALFLLMVIVSANLAILAINTSLIFIFALLVCENKILLKRLLPFVYLFSLILIFHSLLYPSETILWWNFGYEGLIFGATIVLRLIAIVVILQTVLITTSTNEIFQVISGWNRDIGLIMTMLLGIIPVMKRELDITLTVQQTRGLSWNTFFDKIRAYFIVIVPVIMKSLIRAQTMAQLLFLRGYEVDETKTNNIKADETKLYKPTFHKGQWQVYVASLMLAINLVLFGLSLGGLL